jgi:hypothetical protein
MPLPGHPVPGPDRDPADKMGRAVEASPERIRCHLRRPVPSRRDLLTMTAGNTVRETDPTKAGTKDLTANDLGAGYAPKQAACPMRASRVFAQVRELRGVRDCSGS